jgi:hypothetical protein
MGKRVSPVKFIILSFFCLLPMTANGLGLGEVGDLEAQMFS